MTVCDLEGAAKFLEETYAQMSDRKEDKEAKKALKQLFRSINDKRNSIKRAGSFAGSKAVSIYDTNSAPTVATPTPTPQPATPTLTETIEAQYTSLATTLINFVKANKAVDIVMDKGMAVRVIKDPTKNFAFHTNEGKGKSKIRYPDFEGLLADSNAINSIVKSTKLSRDDVVRIATEHRKGFFLKMTKVHEHIHAGAIEFMNENPKDSKTVYVHNLYKKLLKKAETDPKLDGIQNQYWKTNVDEFVAVALSNPEMIAYLDGIPATGFVSALHKLVNTVASMVGINLQSENAALYNIFAQMTETSIEEVANDTKAAEDVEVEDETYTPYPIVDGLKTNRGQTKAINTMIDWYKNGTSSTFMLQGRGGTGKTTVINVLLRELGISPSSVVFATPSNKAKKVLKEANKGTKYSGSSHYTVAQILGLKPEIDKFGNETFVEDPWAEKPDLGKVLVVDEASMLNSEQYIDLLDRTNELKTKIIFMGDNAQLPPVKDPKVRIKALVFGDNKNSTTVLTELMRQEEGSPIIDLTTQIIDVVTEVETAIERELQDPTLVSRVQKARTKPNKTEGETELANTVLSTEAIPNLLLDGEVLNRYDPQKGEGLILTTESFEELLPSFIADYKKTPKTTKYIHFNNEDHAKTRAMTNKIREFLYGDQAFEEQFIKGEPLMLNKPFLYDPHMDGEGVMLTAGEEFTVVTSHVTSKHITYQVGQKYHTTHNTLEVHELTIKDSVTGAEYTVNKPVGTKEFVKSFVEAEKEHFKGANPRGVYMINRALASNFSHGYVINTHKAQGSTYDNVYVGLGNIVGQPKMDPNTTIKSLYVAASRPRKKLVMVDNRNNNRAIINSTTVAQEGERPATIKNVDTAELNDIIDKLDKCKGKG